MEKFIEFRVHWLSFTVNAEKHKGRILYAALFEDHFGPLEYLGHGGRGFREIHMGSLGVKLYLDPVKKDFAYFHLEIPGLACEVLAIEKYRDLISYLNKRYPNLYSIKRLDLAFDYVRFEPKQVEEALLAGRVRTLAKRETMKVFSSPLQLRENGELGTYTVQLGANESERMITVYNKRGFVRLEFQTRDKRSDTIGKELFSIPEIENWYSPALAHLLDFIEFDTPWWKEFIGTQGRANRTVTTAKEITTERLINWLDSQVSPALSAINDAYSEEIIKGLISRGRKRRGRRYNALFPHIKNLDEPQDDK